MKVHVLAVGKIRGPLAEQAADYARRAGFYWNLHVSDVSDGGSRAGDAESVRAAEGARLLKATPEHAWTVALTREGAGQGSRALASWMEGHLTATRELVFWIGGAFGLDATVVAQARTRLSLSSMTLPHDLARVLLLEQIYRAGTILRGEPYHKGQG